MGKIMYNDIAYVGGGGVEVIPNVPLTGSEPNLTSIQIGEQKFKISGSSESGPITARPLREFILIHTKGYEYEPVHE